MCGRCLGRSCCALQPHTRAKRTQHLRRQLFSQSVRWKMMEKLRGAAIPPAITPGGTCEAEAKQRGLREVGRSPSRQHKTCQCQGGAPLRQDLHAPLRVVQDQVDLVVALLVELDRVRDGTTNLNATLSLFTQQPHHTGRCGCTNQSLQSLQRS